MIPERPLFLSGSRCEGNSREEDDTRDINTKRCKMSTLMLVDIDVVTITRTTRQLLRAEEKAKEQSLSSQVCVCVCGSVQYMS